MRRDPNGNGMKSVQVPLTPASNSGARFVQDARYFHKSGAGPTSERVKAQALWISKLASNQSRRFPLTAFIYWSTDALAVHTTELLSAPTALAWFLQSSNKESVCEVVRTVVAWVQQTLHRPGPRMPMDSTRLVLRQTKERVLNQWSLQPSFRAFLERDSVQVGGRVVRGINATMRAVTELIATGEFDRAASSSVHGDIHLGNIITDLDNWWLIDPRGTFAGGETRFDPYYEWGKLLHDCHGMYGLICAGSLRVEIVTAREARFVGPQASELSGHVLLLRRVLQAMDDGAILYGESRLSRKKLYLYEGLILLGIVPFHQENQAKALTIICVGLLMLDRALQNDELELAIDWIR